ncbi:hypothetical protein ACHQM5_014055 [Ranunculus cassubicifolius]
MAILGRVTQVISIPCLNSSFSIQSRFLTTNPQQQYKFPNSSKDFENFIRDRCKSGNLGADEASSMLNRLIQMRPLPSIYPFNQILGAVVKMKRYSSVFHLVKMSESDLILLPFPF